MAIRAGCSTLELNFGDAIMLVAVVLYSGYSVGLRLKPVMHWQSLMLALAVRRSSPRCLLPVGGRRRQGHRARCARLGGHRLYRDRRLDHLADPLHQGQRADRRQPRRPVHQPGADLRHAAFGADRRRDVPALSGAGARRWCWAASGLPNTAGARWRSCRQPERAEQKGADQAAPFDLRDRSGSHRVDVELQPLGRVDRLVRPTCSSTFSGNGAST